MKRAAAVALMLGGVGLVAVPVRAETTGGATTVATTPAPVQPPTTVSLPASVSSTFPARRGGAWCPGAGWLVLTFTAGGFFGGAVVAGFWRWSKRPRGAGSETPRGARDASQGLDSTEAREAFGQQTREFRDLYGALWRAIEGDDATARRVIERWDDRLKRLGHPALLEAWIACGHGQNGRRPSRETAHAWLAMLEGWGLERSQPAVQEISVAFLERFHVVPSASAGRVVVQEPCWLYNGVLLQKGHATPAPT